MQVQLPLRANAPRNKQRTEEISNGIPSWMKTKGGRSKNLPDWFFSICSMWLVTHSVQAGFAWNLTVLPPFSYILQKVFIWIKT